MDDQNKKTDDWFGFQYGRDRAASDADKQQSSAGGEWTRREDPYAAQRQTSAAEPYSFGPFGPQPAQQPAAGEGQEVRELTPQPAAQQREYRPFTVSGGRGAWEMSRPPRRTSFLAIFASFLVGVVAVGGLMFAADRNDWFSEENLGGIGAPSGGSNVQAASAAANSSVSNAADVVRPNNIAKIFEQANPAVVKIETYARSQSSRGDYYDDFFRQFFGDEFGGRGGRNGGQGELRQSGMGSGFLFDSAGYILTNQHVIDGADEIKVQVVGHSEPFTAKLLGSSFELDLAVLKIEGSDFPTLKLGDSNASNLGDWVVAIGNPYGFDHTVTVGVLSAKERSIPISDGSKQRNYEHLLQTDASINPGNSGGPLLNLQGEVIGINTAVSTQAQGIGFAIPTSTILDVLENLKNNVKEQSPFIGAELQDMSEEFAERLGVDQKTGALVRGVYFNSPAYHGDLRQYDIIVGVDGTTYKKAQEIIDHIKSKKVGDKITLNIIRGNNKLDLTIEIGDKNEFTQQQG